ncbi:MAG: ABC transporter ATP-binding protein, partial [Akkermansia sp.]|nr:ABC transporter ATP-binding protein [Akkermansia sp.]
MSARLEALFYRYKGADRDTLRGISLELHPGEMLGLIGADGAGKTTLLRTMAGLLRPTGGYLSILGKDPLKQHTELSPKVGYMSQRFSLYEDLTVAENMQLTAGLRGISPQPEETQQLLQAAGLVPFTRRRAGQLSGGMKQKLALICAMQGDAELLLLDEPGVGVDPVSRRELRALIEQSRTAGHTIVWATAYLDEAAYCDRVCILHEGQVLYLGQPDALLQQVRGRVFAVPCPTTKRLPTLRSLKANA